MKCVEPSSGAGPLAPQAVLLLAHGAPESPDDDLAAYLSDIRGGRPPSPELLEKVQTRYRVVGGSPLTPITRKQAQALERELARRLGPVPVFIGTRHWKPSIREAVLELRKAGIERAVALVMAPHFSTASVGKYRQRLDEALAESGSNIRIEFVPSWWRQPRFLDAWEQSMRAAMKQLPPGRSRAIFTAHSLPRPSLPPDDTYEQQIRENAAALAARLDLTDSIVAFQSAGASPGPWLGPELKEVLFQTARDGFQAVIVAPLGFVADNLELLYDLDIEAKETAGQLGLAFVRCAVPNTSPVFISALADIVMEPS
jgi:protoporphyrin/coproporphyrin ferrochelatase